MAKEYAVELGGQPRTLRYTKNERKQLEKRFGCGLFELVTQQVFPCDQDNRPTGGGTWAAQIAVLHAGLKHAGPAVTETRVETWVDDHIDKDGHVITLLAPAVNAMWAQGVFGMKLDVAELDDDEGKGAAPDSEESTSDGADQQATS